MSNILKEMQNEILKAIDIKIKKYKNESQILSHIEGYITANNGDGTWSVLINGETIPLKPREGLTPTLNKTYLICVVNGDYSKKFIDTIRPY